ncbi:MAG: Hsp20/alpha crystallin family protein [Candidatus Spechtbacterales bacterium]
MENKKSFLEKLGKSLKLEDEQYEPMENQNMNQDEYTEDEDRFERLTPEELEEAMDSDAENEDMENMGEEEEMGGIETTLASARVAQKQKTKSRVSKRESESEEGRLTIDVHETPDEIVVKSTIAGVEPEDLDINITSDSVTIRGERSKDEKVSDDDYFYQELYWGAFARSIILPTEIDADKADATLKNGVLTIRLPKISKTFEKKLKVKPA